MVADPERDVLAPLSAFSLALSGDWHRWQETWKQLSALSPALQSVSLPRTLLEDKRTYKEVFAAALNLLLPTFDLVICDESHNLRGGAGHGAARNRTVAVALGGLTPHVPHALPWDFSAAPRVQRLLCLTATPVEHDFAEMARQAEVFGLKEERGLPRGVGVDIQQLRDHEADDEERKDAARRLVVRRLHELHPAGHSGPGLTKNQYRREWRHGGLESWDAQLPLASPQEQLLVALVQKRVMGLLHQQGRASAGRAAMPSFQMGMLSSFESFHETLAGQQQAEQSSFDGEDQTRNQDDRKGLDSLTVDDICRSYRARFGTAPPHPKMDTVAEHLAGWASEGDKSLVFVRRIRTTEELADKVSDKLSRWLIERLEAELPSALWGHWMKVKEAWAAERRKKLTARQAALTGDDESDEGGVDSFFAWFFRGAGDKGHHVTLSTGARLRRQCFQSAQHPWSVLFHDDHVAWLVDEPLSEWVAARSFALEVGARNWMPDVQRPGPRHRFEAWQAAGLELLAMEDGGVRGRCARWLLEQLYPLRRAKPFDGEPGAPADGIGVATFFSTLRRHPLGDLLWPDALAVPDPNTPDGLARIRSREHRRELMASTLRLGHPAVDLWTVAVKLAGAFEVTAGDAAPVGSLADALLERLHLQREDIVSQSTHTAWKELSQLAAHHALLVDVNFPDVVEEPLHRLTRYFQDHLSRQAPAIAMHGGSKSQQAMTQFRMPGYPLVIVATDVLQEGVDLHTFCARVVHYGIAHTSSATEQRTGRVDRIGSLVHRRLDLEDDASKLQVHYPHLTDTIEPLQLQVLYQRMDRFLKMVHDGLGSAEAEPSRVNLDLQKVRQLSYRMPPEDRLVSAFEVREEDLEGGPLSPALAIDIDRGGIEAELARWSPRPNSEVGSYRWTGDALVRDGALVEASPDVAEAQRQPFVVELRTRRDGRGLLLRVESPLGHIDLHHGQTAGKLLREQAALRGACMVSREAHRTRPWVEVRCELPLGDGSDTRTRLQWALTTAVCQAARYARGGRHAGYSLDADIGHRSNMSAIRAALQDAPDIEASPAGRLVATVKLGQRSQSVRVTPVDHNWWQFRSRIARLAALSRKVQVTDLARLLLQVNQDSELVRISRDKDSLWATFELPVGSPDSDAVNAVRRVAGVADRWELVWVGDDIE